MEQPPRSNAAAEPKGDARRLSVRVYYEDTDFSGFVYHAAYLRFLERARTEWLRSSGFEQRNLKQGDAMTFAVRRLQIDFLKPAAMDDVLTVHTEIRRAGGASIDFGQTIVRGAAKIAEATVCVALLKGGRAARIPPDMRERILQVAEMSDFIETS